MGCQLVGMYLPLVVELFKVFGNGIFYSRDEVYLTMMLQKSVQLCIRSCVHYENISWHGKYAVALLRERIFIDKTKKYPPHGKWRNNIEIVRYYVTFSASPSLMDT